MTNKIVKMGSANPNPDNGEWNNQPIEIQGFKWAGVGQPIKILKKNFQLNPSKFLESKWAGVGQSC